jgi:hypothetical protein
MQLIDIKGKRYGRLVVVQKDRTPRKWLCKCDCGNTTLATGPNLRRGGTTSCGCALREWSSKLGSTREYVQKRAAKITQHGHKRRGQISIEYQTWLSIKRRCYDPKYKDYANWGGRGIEVCERWRTSFSAFLEDMGDRPEDKESIDRLDPNGNYEPCNCRWATLTEQGSENRRGMHSVIYKGREYQSLAAACRASGLKYTTVFQRIAAGYSIEAALDGGISLRRTI